MLAGTRVLDLTRVLAGPFCTMMLGDLGADIIKVESLSGDDTRAWGPPFHSTGESCYFQSVNRNKRSIAVDFKHPEGAALLRQLAASCDVVVENFLPKKLAQFGMDYDALTKLKKDIIYCSITGFGQEGAWSQRPGYDVVVAALGGLLSITGPDGGEPCRVGVAVTDLSTGLHAYSSVLAALLQHARTGKGVHIDCNLLATQFANLSHVASNYLNCGVDGRRWGTQHPSLVPYQAFSASDGRQFIIGAGNDGHFALLCHKMGRAELAEDARFLHNSDRVTHRKELIAILAEEFVKRPLDHWESLFVASTLPMGRLNTVGETCQLPEMERYICNMKDGDETVSVPGPAVNFSSSSFHSSEHSVAPRLGQHTRDLLSELSFSQEQVDDYQTRGIVK